MKFPDKHIIQLKVALHIGVVRSGKVDTRLSSVCTSNKINPWSKWKPIQANAVTLTNDLLKDNNYGIKIISANNLSSFIDLIKDNGNKGYRYLKPTGGATSPYRLGDFRNYNSEALLPVWAHYKDGQEVKIGGITSSNHGNYEEMIIGFEVPDSTNPDEQDYLSKDMLYNLMDDNGSAVQLRKGVYFTDGKNSCWFSEKAYYWTTEFRRFEGKTIDVYEFLTNAKRTPTDVWSPSIEDRFFALPEPYHTIKVSGAIPAGSRKVAVICHAKYMNSFLSNVDYTLQFSAVGEVYGGGTIKNVWIRLSTDSEGLQTVSSKKIADSLTIPNETTSIEYTGFMPNRGQSMVYVLVYYDNAIQWRGVPMMDPGDQEVQ